MDHSKAREGQVLALFMHRLIGKDVYKMFEIKGKVTTAICYAKVIEDEAIEQIRRMCDYDLTRGSKVRIMPDVHAGKGCTIGTTMTITDKICPNIVGVDIGCGMYTVKLQNQVIDFEKIDEACHYIPSGMNVWDGRMERFDLTQLKCYRSLRDAKRLERSLGTLGGGNHFIEVDQAKDGTYYLIIQEAEIWGNRWLRFTNSWQLICMPEKRRISKNEMRLFVLTKSWEEEQKFRID